MLYTLSIPPCILIPAKRGLFQQEGNTAGSSVVIQKLVLKARVLDVSTFFWPPGKGWLGREVTLEGPFKLFFLPQMQMGGDAARKTLLCSLVTHEWRIPKRDFKNLKQARKGRLILNKFNLYFLSLLLTIFVSKYYLITTIQIN